MTAIRTILADAVADALQRLGIEADAGSGHLERPARREHGDWSTNLALPLARKAGRPPRQLATDLQGQLEQEPPPHVQKVEVAGPGFLNFRLDDGWLYDVLQDVVEQGEANYGRGEQGQGRRVVVEFVSANPTGPLHVGNGWWASYGDAVARLLDRSGWQVSREYYVNDTGGQIRALGASLLARRNGEPLPEDGYPGGFLKGLAAA